MASAAGNAARITSFGRTSVRGLQVADRERASIPCHFLCTECGLLVDQTSLAGYRGLDRTEAPATCGHCGSEGAWADLREEAVIEQLKVRDEELPEQPRTVRRVFSAVVLGTTIAVLGTLGLAAAGLFLYVFLGSYALSVVTPADAITKHAAGIAFLGAFLFVFGGYINIAYLLPAFRRRLVRGRKHPLRWLTRPAAVDSLTAPLTGRPCLGYEVAIRKNDDPDAHAGTWLLVERHGAIDPDPVRQRVDVRLQSPVVAEFLRRRGIDPVGLSLVVYETVVA